ncbi:MAG: hypothetical protein ACLFTT_09355 [Candidatus Hydrogenedentota bacterium]
MDLNERLKQIEESLARRKQAADRKLEERLGQLDAKLGKGDKGEAPARPMQRNVDMPRHAEVDLSGAPSLAVFDDAMERAFDLHGRLGGSMADYPTTYCETVREYVTPLLAGMPLSEAQRADALGQIEAAAQGMAPPGIVASLGVHLPGVGSFINGWRMAHDASQTPAEFLRTEAGFAEVAATVAHEKWGHGFISELTASGQEKQALQLGMNHLAGQLGLQDVDTPEHARLMAQWEILFLSSHYVEEGFATWIAHYLAETLTEAQGLSAYLEHAPRFERDQILAALKRVPDGDAAHAALRALFSESGAGSIEDVHETMCAALHALDQVGEAFAHAVGMPAPYAVGYCLMDAIAQRHGPKCVPYAVATACNVRYGLETISNHDLRNYIAAQPNLNINTRLALMMFVSPGDKNGIDGFLQRIHDETGLTPAGKG